MRRLLSVLLSVLVVVLLSGCVADIPEDRGAPYSSPATDRTSKEAADPEPSPSPSTETETETLTHAEACEALVGGGEQSIAVRLSALATEVSRSDTLSSEGVDLANELDDELRGLEQQMPSGMVALHERMWDGPHALVASADSSGMAAVSLKDMLQSSLDSVTTCTVGTEQEDLAAMIGDNVDVVLLNTTGGGTSGL